MTTETLPLEEVVEASTNGTAPVDYGETPPEKEVIPKFGDPRDAVVSIIRDRLERMLQPVDDPKPVAWLADGEYDRLYWAIARARGHESSTSEDEADAQVILAELETIQQASDTPVWPGVNVITAKDLNAATAEPLPPASIFAASVRTPAFLYVSAVCPVCGIASEIDLEVGVKLIVEGHSRKLKLTAKAAEKPHQCYQQRLEDLAPTSPAIATGQMSLDDAEKDDGEGNEVPADVAEAEISQDGELVAEDIEATDHDAIHALANVPLLPAESRDDLSDLDELPF